MSTAESHDDVQDLRAQLDAIHRSHAVIEFELDGTIRTANANFLSVVGYELEEIQGQHHRMFVSEEHAASEEYAGLWKRLAAGEFFSGEYQRFTKDGREIWINASYNPIFDEHGKPYKVVKFASDITQEKLRAHDAISQIEALNRSHAVIEFELDGTIRTANDNFCGAIGHTLEAIEGEHHRMFMFPEDAATPGYSEHWERLAQGDFFAGEFRRMTASGEDLWIYASYNPIHKPDGTLWKVVKFASDITPTVRARKEAAETAKALAASAQELNAVSHQMSSNAGLATEKTSDVTRATDRSSAQMNSLAGSTEEMTASINEISANAQMATEVANEAVEAARSTTDTVRRLTASSEEIESVIKVITSIAQQTNLLALNASIEAARAGSAGAGFAVVAGEVKQLARQTADATGDIGERIRAIQTETTQSVTAMETISETIDRINALQSSIASAVEEQTATTQEMRNQVHEASSAISTIEDSVRGVTETTEQTGQVAQTTASSAEELNSIAERLERLVDQL